MIEELKKASEISQHIKKIAKTIKKGDDLYDFAEFIENEIKKLGGGIAFPTNLSIDDIAAHYTPNEKGNLAKGLLKIDFGIEINGFIADTAISVDLENNELNKKLIGTSEAALEKAVKVINKNIALREIGKAIEDEIRSRGLQPIINLSGHKIERYELHAGLTIPNFDNKSEIKIDEGLYAIEPFVTNGIGRVKDGKPSGIYLLEREGNVRDRFARKVLEFIHENYGSLPFCLRWLTKEFGPRAKIAMKWIEQANIVHQFSQLVEVSNKKVAQTEKTVFLGKEKFILTK